MTETPTTEVTETEAVAPDTTVTTAPPLSIFSDTSEATSGEATEDAGERPEWLPEKFKTPQDVLKSFDELQKKYSQSGSPESYDNSLLADNALIDTESELFKEYIDVSKDAHISQEYHEKTLGMLNKLVQQFADASGAALNPEQAEAAIDKQIAEQKTLLGSDADEKISRVYNWAMNKFGEEGATEFLANNATAAGVNRLNEIISMQGGAESANIPVKQESQTSVKQQLGDLETRMVSEYIEYQQNPKLRREISEERQRLTSLLKKGN